MEQRQIIRWLGLLGLCAIASGQAAATTVIPSLRVLPSQQAFSGLVLIPNAQVAAKGQFSFTFAQGLPFEEQIADVDSLLFNIGLLPGMELSGRVVTEEYSSDCFREDCGDIRDLSGSFKYQFPQWFGPQWNLAIGSQDLGGAANNFATYYAVADYSPTPWPVRISAGVGTSDLSFGVMDGVFAGVEYQPFSFLQLALEYDGAGSNGAIKVMTPPDWLPYGASASASHQVFSSHPSEQPMWFAQLQVPLLGLSHNQPQSPVLALEDKVVAQQRFASVASLSMALTALEQEGFLNLRLGRWSERVVISYENRRYDHDQLDGLGVALGILSSYLGTEALAELGLTPEQDNLLLVQLINGLPMMAVDTSIDCYRGFIRDGAHCGQLQFYDSYLGDILKQVQWQGPVRATGLGRSQIILQPGVRYAVATEFGVLDYSFAFAPNWYLPLWAGAALDLRYLVPISNSDDYQEGYWEAAQFSSELDRALVHQAFRFGDRITTQFSAGQVFADYRGVLNDSRWSTASGRHSMGWELSWFAPKQRQNEQGFRNDDRSTLLARYQYSAPDWQWQLGITAGQFWRGDKGVSVVSTHWLGDVAIEATYLNSKLDEAEREEFFTLSVSLPLTFWRDMAPGYIQLRGTEQFTLGLQTRIGDSDNLLNGGLGDEVNLQHRISRQYYNRNRYGSDYYSSHIHKMRHAYLRYVATVLP
ncbi:MAG: hypothetical protein R3Y10_00130 [Ferrimonas sp.]